MCPIYWIRGRWTWPLARASSLYILFPCPGFTGWQLCHATRIVRWSQYNTQQVLQAAGLLRWWLHHHYLFVRHQSLQDAIKMAIVSTRHATDFANAHTRIFSGHVHRCNPGWNFVHEVRSAKTTKFYTSWKFVNLTLWYVNDTLMVTLPLSPLHWARMCRKSSTSLCEVSVVCLLFIVACFFTV